MSSLNYEIMEAKEKFAQLKRKKIEQDIRAENIQKKMDTRRSIIVGDIISAYFPEIKSFHPQRTADENKNEFALLETMVSILSRNRVYINNLEKLARKMLKNSNK